MVRHLERSVHVAAVPAEVFRQLDDQTRLAAHMEKPSTMMGGGQMNYEFDEDRGQTIGSHIKMSGSAFGLHLFVDEVVIERTPPSRKVWKTTGPTRLLIIAEYAMGFEIAPDRDGSKLRVWIDYALPADLFGRAMGLLLAPLYARWCVGRMAKDAAQDFALPAHGAAGPAGSS